MIGLLTKFHWSVVFDMVTLCPLYFMSSVSKSSLINLIRRSPEISGFHLPGAKGQQVRVLRYADDTTCVIQDVRSLTKLFECVHVYELGSDAKLNRSKTEAMWLGAWMSRANEPPGLTWVRKVKVLGVVFATVSCEEDNWEPKIKKLEKFLNLWRSRSLSLLGKAAINNTVGLSKHGQWGQYWPPERCRECEQLRPLDHKK